MPTRAAAAAALLGAGEEEEEEEEDEPLALPPAPAAATGSRKKKAEAADEEQQPPEWQQPDTKRARSGKATLSTDVGELQAALGEAEARVEAFQAREAGYLRSLAEKGAEARALQLSVKELGAFHSPIETWARRAVLGPGVALELRMLQEKVVALEAEARKWREEAGAANFSAQSAAGQMALAKVRKLQEQNAELTRRLEAADHAREARARLEAEIASLKQRLAEAEAANEELDGDRGLLAGMVFVLKKQLAQYEQGGEVGAATSGVAAAAGEEEGAGPGAAVKMEG